MSRFIVSVILVSISPFAAIGAINRPSMELITVAPDGQSFIESDSGCSYIPFGTNYYDPYTGWAPKLWRLFDAEKVRQHFREHLADEWVRRQVEAIRRADPTHLITVGYIQWSYPLVRSGNPNRYAAFNPHRQTRWLDFMTIHFYPTLGSPFESEQNHRKNIGYLQGVLAYCHIGKPVVLGEFGWYGGGAPQHHPYLSEQQQARWIGEEIEASRSLADGWLSWPFADSPESGDISLFAGLVKADLTLKAWGHKFKGLAANLPELKKSTPKLPSFDFPIALTANDNELSRIHQAYVKDIQQAIGEAGVKSRSGK
jgi:endo-1,4-beta-mannosidase